MKTAKSFNGDKLRLARLLNGYTQKQLGDCVSVSRQFIHQMESDDKSPANDVLEALCEALKVECKFFEKPVGNDVKFEQCHFRKRRTTPVGLSHRVLSFSTVFEELVEYFHGFLDLPEKNIPDIKRNQDNYSNEEIERAAEFCRRGWGLGTDAPISNITRVLENAGVVITHFSGVSEKVDALSVNRRYPIIVRNTAKESVCRMRFDLAHELGHFVLHDGIETGDKITEGQADKFASAFLFPRSAFIKEFPDMKNSRIKWKLIYQLKIRWKMSVRAIIYRAHYLGLISAQQFRSANVRLNKTGQTKTEDFDELIEPEQPEILETAFDLMREELGITFGDIAKVLGVKKEMLTDITGVREIAVIHANNVTPIAI